MKLLLINQPLKNRGDEAAHRALVRSFLKSFEDVEIIVLFPDSTRKEIVDQYNVHDARVKYIIQHFRYDRFTWLCVKLGLCYKMYFLWRINPQIRQWLTCFEDADLVVCAPGGICMGGFQNWNHLFNLGCARYLNKPLAYYGRSFGPFPTETRSNRLFRKVSLELLDYFSFLSIRDSVSQNLADELGLDYVAVTDSAFLEVPEVSIPVDVESRIPQERFFVFVPNLLIWHHAYEGRITKAEMVDLYCTMLSRVLEMYPDMKCVMLPQTFGYRTVDANDVNLFRTIKDNLGEDRIVVFDDTLGSDLQQMIIRRADFLIGGRYHSVVFAINNGIPFVALSYEHKISGLLQQVDKTDAMVDISEAVFTKEGRTGIVEDVVAKLPGIVSDERARTIAVRLSAEGMSRLKDRFHLM